jgi:hypothetical protein
MAGPARAQETIQVLGTRELTIPAEDASKSNVEIQIPVRCQAAASGCRSSAQGSVVALPTVQVTLGGQTLDPSTFGFNLRANGVPGLATLLVTIDLKKATAAGAYAVKVLAPQTTEQQAPPPQILEFTFTRPAAELRIATPLRIERVVYLPWLWHDLFPTTLILTETAGRSALIPAAGTWTTDLRRADNRPLGARLNVTLPQAINAWRPIGGADGAGRCAVSGDGYWRTDSPLSATRVGVDGTPA